MKLRFLGNLKRSLTAKITLSIAVISILLIAGAGPMITRLATRELREGNELIIFANLALLREDLAAARFDLTQEPERLVKRMDLQLGSLPMALLDEQRRSVGRSERFEVPVSTPPAQPMPVDNVPTGIEHADVRALGKAPGPLTTVWTWADGRSFRLLFARIPVPPGSLAGAGVRGVLVVFALEPEYQQRISERSFRLDDSRAGSATGSEPRDRQVDHGSARRHRWSDQRHRSAHDVQALVPRAGTDRRRRAQPAGASSTVTFNAVVSSAA